MTNTSALRDSFGRPLRSLRVSVTDRCNLRCMYCMPEEEYVWLPKTSILSFEELDRLVRVFAGLGVEKVRLTGGEPLLRHDVTSLVGLLKDVPGIRDLALTTNGVLLDRYVGSLREAGLDRVTVSLDTLRPDRYLSFSRSMKIDAVLKGLEAVGAAGLDDLKINTVLIRGFNDDEIFDLLEFADRRGAELRFIEYMDVGGATGWSMDSVVSRDDILQVLKSRYGRVEPLTEAADSSAPARRFRLPNGQTFGIVASTTEPFCSTCDRARVTADGVFYKCLYADDGLDLRDAIRAKPSDDDLRAVIVNAWTARTDRGAEDRLGMADRDVLHQIDGLRSDPHREMHTRGG